MNLNKNLNEEIYFKKYLKYKSKYSKLMNLVGGVPEKKIFIISSHHNRMVITIFETLVLMGQTIPEISFNLDNCTILKIDKVAEDVKIKMISPVVNTDPKYRSICQINELQLSIPMSEFPSDLIIYLVRHGQGFHNISGSSEADIHDAVLTPTGKGQVLLASRAINQDIDKLPNKNYKIFLGCSHLKRTWQTVYNLYNNLSSELKEHVKKEIFIIPCLHEMVRQINTSQHYQHDSPSKRTALNPFLAEEKYKGQVTHSNISADELKHVLLESKPKNNIYDGIKEHSYQETDSEVINLNWSYYTDIHMTEKKSYEHCAEITVIKAICNFYNYLQTNRLFE